MGFDISRAVSSAEGIPTDCALVSIRAAFWASSFNSMVFNGINGILLCDMVDNGRMQKDEGVGEIEALVSDV